VQQIVNDFCRFLALLLFPAARTDRTYFHCKVRPRMTLVNGAHVTAR
jgi:hypothetical protein